MRKLLLMAAMTMSVAAMTVPASAGPVVNGIPPVGGGVHGLIIHRCHYGYRCCRHRWGRRCGPHGIIIGRPIGRPIGLRPIGRPIGISPHGIGPVGPAHGGLVNGVPVQERTQH